VRVARFDAAVAAGLDAARRQRLFAILRFQDRRERRLLAADGAVDRAVSTTSVGVGVHALTTDGWAGFASTDDCAPSAVARAVERAGALARAAGVRGALANRAVFGLPDEGSRTVPHDYARLHDVSIQHQTDALLAAHEAARALPDAPSVRTTHVLVDEQWRVARSDGTDVSFATPRARARHALTVRRAARPVSASASISGADVSALAATDRLAALDRRTRHALRGALDTHDAPSIAPGSYRVALDYALAKGLAHEAIGHLCESDVDTSPFFRDGRLALGDEIGAFGVSVIDGPVRGDYAFQDVSANGMARGNVALVERGVLVGGLADLFSAEAAGIPLSGACRAGSFRERPVPRMTNVRIVVAGALPLAGSADAVEPEDAADALRRAGLLGRDGGEDGAPFLYLTGYRGGQADPRRGDFVLSAAAAYDLGDGGAPRRAPTLSGLAGRVLRAVRAGVGPLQLDAAGSCGKDGRAVSSSGGSHALLVLDAGPDLIVGGAP